VTGGYSADKRVSSFVGFVPAQDPRLTILVVLDEPQDKTYGGLVAAPVFSRVATQALRYIGVAPQQTARSKPPAMPLTHEKDVAFSPVAMTEGREIGDNGPGRMPDLNGMSYRQVLQVMERTGLNIKLQGSGRVVDQKPAAGAAIRYGSEVRVRFEPPVRRS
jgi:cell division protein FtsI (penicillin-binding protein 3)